MKLIRTTIAVFTVLFSVGIVGAPARSAAAAASPDALCWQLVEAAAANVRYSRAGRDEDALQTAILQVFERCLAVAADPAVTPIKNYDAFIVRTVNNLRISSWRKHEARVIATDFTQRQNGIRSAFGNPVFDASAAMGYWRDADEADTVSSMMRVPEIAAHLTVPITQTLTTDEIKVALLHLAGVPVTEIVANSNFEKTKIYDLRKSGKEKLEALFAEYSQFWSFEAMQTVWPTVLFYALAAALVFVLGIATISMIRALFKNTEHAQTAEDFYHSRTTMKAKVALAQEKQVIVVHSENGG